MKCKSKIGFVISDPCYVLAREIYHNIWGEHNYKDGEISVGNNNFCVHGTAYGDGCYKTSTNTFCAVDSGTLAVIPMELVSKELLKNVDTIIDTSWINSPGEVELIYENGTFSFILNEKSTMPERIVIETN